MRLLQGSWCEILTLTLVYRSLGSSKRQTATSCIVNRDNESSLVKQVDARHNLKLNKIREDWNTKKDEQETMNPKPSVSPIQKGAKDALVFTPNFSLTRSMARECGLLRYHQIVSLICFFKLIE